MISFKNFSLSYDNKSDAIKDISLNINKGECLLITGESGSGKSTIINSINAITTEFYERSYKGEIKLNDKDVLNLELSEVSKIVQTVFQNPKTHFFNIDTTSELLFFMENNGYSREKMDERIKNMLEIFPIKHLLDRNIFELSGGERQILSIASSYIAGTDIIVLDEPSSNLDDVNTKIIAKMLKILKSHGITLVIAEHRIFYLMEIVDRVIFIKDGKIIKDYTAFEFKNIDDATLNKMGIRSKSETTLLKKELKNGNDIIIKNLNFKFKDHSISIDELGFSVGKIYGIIGKNGIGKTTFVNALTGLLKSKMKYFYNGIEQNERERIKLSGLVMQDVNHQLFSDSIINEVTMGVKDIDKKDLEEKLEALGLFKLKENHPMGLSGGQKQRIAILQTIVSNKKIICFDEPTSGMDYKNMIKISNLIKSIKDDKIIFIISHDKEFLNLTTDYNIDMEAYKIH